MTHRSGLLERWIEVRPAGPGRPAFGDKLELLFWVLLFVVALGTPTTRADGAANAPGEELIRRWTGGSLCVYRRVTGIPCPGCGLSHGFVHLAHGQVAAAVADNPLTPGVFVGALLRLASVAIVVFRRREVAWRLSWTTIGLLGGACALSGLCLGVWRVYQNLAPA